MDARNTSGRMWDRMMGVIEAFLARQCNLVLQLKLYERADESRPEWHPATGGRNTIKRLQEFERPAFARERSGPVSE